MPRKLKVFQTSLGFYDSIIAAPSQIAALRAWGTDRDLFSEGSAQLATDPQAIEAALEHPGTPLRRPVGSHDAFSLRPKLPKASDIVPEQAPSRTKPVKKENVETSPPPDRSALESAEAVLAGVDKKQKQEKADLGRQRRELDEEQAKLSARRAVLEEEETRSNREWDSERRIAKQRMERERRAYRKAGGTD